MIIYLTNLSTPNICKLPSGPHAWNSNHPSCSYSTLLNADNIVQTAQQMYKNSINECRKLDLTKDVQINPNIVQVESEMGALLKFHPQKICSYLRSWKLSLSPFNPQQVPTAS